VSGVAQRRSILNLQALPPLALFLLGLAIIWAPGRPAMVDISQHSAEIAMWRDLILGRSAWAADLRVDLATPYFLGYALALPLALVMTPLAAIKVVLTAAYAAFGLIGRAIGGELDAPASLDSYYFIPFFSVAWSYGMFPFLVAAPLGLGLIWASLRYARGGGAVRGLLVSVLGLATLLSHAFVFVFAMAVGAGLVAVSGRPLRRLIPMAWPFVAPSLVCLLLFFHATGSEAASVGHYGLRVHAGAAILRAGAILGGSFDDWSAPWSWSVGVGLYFLPFICGLRVAPKRGEAWIIAGALVAIIALTPLEIMEMWIYPRFSLFVLPAYAWLFARPSAPSSPLAAWLTPRIGLFAAILGGFGLIQHINEQRAFSREAQDFDGVLARAAPGRRALSLVYDQQSAIAVNPLVYLHFPQWYAVEKGGFVDLSFAEDPHEVVRFSHAPPPPYDDVKFEMTNHPSRPVDPARWSYIFVRGRIPPGIFAGCQPVQIAAEGSWRLLAPRPCPPK
jgi:hypothetical protein